MPGGRAGTGLSRFIPSNDGVTPRYQAVGEDGETLEGGLPRSSANIGFGVCMLPSDPRLRCVPGIPYPGLDGDVVTASTSPKSGLRGAAPIFGARSVMDWEAYVLFASVGGFL